MKPHPMHPKPKAGGRAVTPQQAAFELKQRVVLSLNKLADRDTQQIGIEELERAAEGLAPDAIAPFLSCVAETDSEQKSAVRRECVRVMGTLARFHGALLAPHLGKMVAGLVKRLKDPDSAVRDACIETAGVLAATVGAPGGGEGGGAAFVALARPLFEALGEQNRYVQAGSALCLARVIDEAVDHPTSILPHMLSRVVKLLKNPHFMAKPSAIELIRSIIQAGGASTEHTMSAAVTAILEALKNTDWTTRKAASVALADITVSAAPLLGSFKTSCIRSLECCRFDKVKPVRDAIMHALQCWKTLPGANSLESSEAGSSTKENFGGDYSEVSSVSAGGRRDVYARKAGPVSALSGNSTTSIKKRTPLAVRKTCPNYVQNRQHVRPNDWNIEISVPKTLPSTDPHYEESGGSCAAKAFERAADATRGQAMKYDYESTYGKPECSSMSDLISGSFETKHVTIVHGCFEDGDASDLIRMNNRSAIGEIDPEGRRLQDRKSLDSSVGDSCSRGVLGCCSHAANELAFIRKQLSEIETRQSNLMDLLQVFMGNSMDGLSTLQLKVHNLEHTVDKIAHGIAKNENHSIMPVSKLLKQTQSVSSSPRLSSSTPRPSVDANYRQPPSSSMKNREIWGEVASSKSRSSTSVKDGAEIWSGSTLDMVRNPMTKGIKKNSCRGGRSSGGSQPSISACNGSARQCTIEAKPGFWKQVKESLCAGDVESAYTEALCSGDDLCLIELMDRTGPVLESLSHDTASEILSSLASHFVDHRFLDSIIPWLQQVVNLSSAHEPRHFVLPAKVQMEFLLASEEVAAVEFADPVDRASVAQLAAELSRLWGNCSRLEDLEESKLHYPTQENDILFSSKHLRRSKPLRAVVR